MCPMSLKDFSKRQYQTTEAHADWSKTQNSEIKFTMEDVLYRHFLAKDWQRDKTCWVSWPKQAKNLPKKIHNECKMDAKNIYIWTNNYQFTRQCVVT
jgi:hypothetical protein